jgi:Ca-activated chloride channel family protein|tara:strand:+ start:1065 stop:3062 length:1998 start_codon:yes stop_codon:yes gene_type:complete
VAEARQREYGSRAFLEQSFVHFEHSQILWLAALIMPLLGLFLGWAWRRRRERVTRFIHANLVKQLTLGLSTARRKAKLALLLGVVLLLFLALARPKGGYELQKTETRSLDILVAVDTSRSMLATDQTPNRLERAKLAVLDLMRLAKRDRLGLIAFSGTAFLQCPLTIDRNAFVQNVNSLTTDIIPQGGTAIGEAVSEALRTFEKEEDNHKVLVLMTDGEDHETGVTDAVQKANDIGMKIFTIGLGSTEGELIQLPDPQTSRLEFLKDENGNVVKSRLNEPLLRELSADTGAFYLPLQGADTMERLYEAGLAGLTPNRVENQMTKRYIERYQWPLGLAILLLLGEMLLGEGRRQSHKNKATALAALGLLMFPPATLATPADAWRAMEQEDYGNALRLYEELLEKNPKDARLHYNAGAAAYRTGNFEKARNHFNSTLASPEAPLPLQQRAFYNLGNAMFRLGETTDNPDDKAKQWIDALKKFEGALKLSQQLKDTPDDEDAQFNTDIVKKRLEQLQQQQQQQSDDKQDKENQDKNEQQKDQQKQQKSDDPKKQEQEQQQNDQQQKQDQQKGDDEKKEQQQQQSGQKQEEKKEEQQKQDSSNREDNKEQPQPSQGQKQSDDGQSQPDGKMTPEQVRQLLDTLKQQERSLIYRPVQKEKARRRGITKNW